VQAILIGYNHREIDKEGEEADFKRVLSTFDQILMAPKYWILQPFMDKSDVTGYYIMNVCVAPEHRGKGIGSLLIRNFCETHKADIWLDVELGNKAALQLYERLGFSIASKKSIFLPGLGSYRMVRQPVAGRLALAVIDGHCLDFVRCTMLRYKADVLSVFYMIVTTALLIVNWNLPEFNVWLFLGSILMATSCFAMAHNHNHIPMWRVDFLNKLTDYWLTLFYGFPVYAWIPTHNMNHHQLNNREGDYTITWRLSERNNLFTMITFPFVSAVYQQKPTSDFLKHYWNVNKPKFFYYISQYVVWVLWIAGAFYLDSRKALLYVAIPMIVATQFVLIINYIQHVHTDEESQYNHSRNFHGPL
jgi:GNAT superfamily N-acetyltransferase